MPKGHGGQKRPADDVGMSVMVARVATGEVEGTSYSSQNRRKSGLAGAEAPNEILCAERRTEIAKNAASARWQKGEKEMTELCSSGLHGLLSEGGRELHNIKFLAGTAPTDAGMCEEAKRVIKSAFGRDMPHNPPHTGREKSML
jgi:hypothetical protein